MLYILYALRIYIRCIHFLFYFYRMAVMDLNSLYQFTGTAFLLIYLVVCIRMYVRYMDLVQFC